MKSNRLIHFRAFGECWKIGFFQDILERVIVLNHFLVTYHLLYARRIITLHFGPCWKQVLGLLQAIPD